MEVNRKPKPVLPQVPARRQPRCGRVRGLVSHSMNMSRKNLLWVGTCCAVAWIVCAAWAGEDTGLTAAPVKAAIAPPGYKGPIEFEGKVVVVNRAERTITVELNGKLYLFRMTPQARILRKGKPVQLAEVTTGQKIRVIARMLDDGSLQLATPKADSAWLLSGRDDALQLVSVDVEPSEAAPGEPAGTSTAPGLAKRGGAPPTPQTVPIEQKPGQGQRHLPPPFQGGYFPGHVEKVVVSPHK